MPQQRDTVGAGRVRRPRGAPKRKPPRVVPGSRSDAAQRRGARTPAPPRNSRSDAAQRPAAPKYRVPGTSRSDAAQNRRSRSGSSPGSDAAQQKSRRNQPKYSPPLSSPGSDAAQRRGARTAERREARQRGKSDAAQGGHRLTLAQRRARDRIIFDLARINEGKRRQGAGFRFIESRATAPYRYARDLVEHASETIEDTADEIREERERGGSGRGALLRGGGKLGVQSGGFGLPIPEPAKRGVRAIGEAVIEEPGKTLRNTGGGLKDMAQGAIPGLVALGVDTVEGTQEGDPLRGVKRAGSEYLDDLARRYGPLFKGAKGEREFKERIKEEGFAAEGVDVAGLVAGPGGVASRGVSAAARSGRLGAGRRSIVADPRMREQTSGGRVREQALSPGYFRARRQKKRDVKAFEGQQREIRRADAAAAERRARTGDGPGRGPVDAVVRKATEAGNVVPSRVTLFRDGRVVKVGRAPSKRRLAKRQRVAYGGEKGATLMRQKEELRREGLGGGGRGASRAYAALSANEKRAYKHAIQSGATTAPALATAARARIELIERTRGDGEAPAARDELVTLRQIAAEPEKFMGPGLAAVVRAERERGARLAADDPRLGDTVEERVGRAQTRRALPQAMLFGVQRGGTPIREAEAAARAGVRTAKAQRKRAGRALLRAERKAAREEGRARLLVEQADARRGARGKSKGARTVSAAEYAALPKLYRGVGRELEGGAQADFDSGGHAHRGDGISGGGLYATPDRGYAKHHAYGDDARVAEFALSPDAKVISRAAAEAAAEGRESGADAARRLGYDVMREEDSAGPDAGEVVVLNPAVIVRPEGAVARGAGSGTIGRAERAARIHEKAAANHRRRARRARSEKAREAHGKLAEAAEDRAAAARARLSDLEGKEGREPRATLNRLEKAQAGVLEAEQRQKAVAEAVAAAKERVKQTRAARRAGVKLVDPEPWADFLERVTDAARANGLEEPGFFPSQPRSTVRRSVFTSGGFRSVPRDRSYTGTLFREGREDGSFVTYAQGLARNLKGKHNWRLVTDTIEEHALPGYRNRSVEELRKMLERDGIDMDSVGFWSPGVFREAGQAADPADAPRLADDDLQSLEDIRGHVEEGGAMLAESVRLAMDAGRFGTSRDWVVVPKGVLDELEADTNPSGWLGRGVDRAKSIQSRVLLGTSPAWIQFQVVANMLQTTIAGVGPAEIVRANLWWRGLTPEERAAVEPYVGIGAFTDSLDKPRIGAAADNALVNAWRAFTGADFWHKPRRPLAGAAVSQLNPLDVLFRIDNVQNRAFRRAVLYNRVKRDAYARMGESMTRMQRTQTRVMGHLGRGPEELDAKMRGILGERPAMEQHARAVADFLGDYTTYSARERRTLGRSIMFYGYLRFSLRFAFYTMPTKHPVMLSIIAQLGRLQTAEVERLLGGRELPWKLGAFYYTVEGEDRPRSVNIARANPFLNTITELDPRLPGREQIRNAVRFLPPIYIALADQVYGKSSFTGKDFRTGGAPREEAAGDEGRVRIFFNDMARLNAIYREIDKAAAGGVPQGDDSILGDRPTVYKRADIVGGINRSRLEFEEQGGAVGSVVRGLTPLLPRPDNAPEVAAKIRQLRGTSTVTPGGPVDPEQRALLEEARREAQANAPTAREREALLREARAAAGGG